MYRTFGEVITPSALNLTLAGELIGGIAELAEWKKAAMELRGQEATVLCDFIQKVSKTNSSKVRHAALVLTLYHLQYLDQSEDNDPGPGNLSTRALRLLQDICTASGELPTSCWVYEVNVNVLRPISSGGEAIIYHGTYKERAVAVRNVVPPGGNWDSLGARHTLKVSTGLQSSWKVWLNDFHFAVDQTRDCHSPSAEA